MHHTARQRLTRSEERDRSDQPAEPAPDPRETDPPPPQSILDEPIGGILRRAAERAGLAAAVGAVTWVAVPISFLLLVSGRAWPPMDVLVPMAVSFAVTGLILSGVSAFVERCAGGEKPSEVRALLSSGFVFGAALIVIQLLGRFIDQLGPAASGGAELSASVAVVAPPAYVAVMVASVIALPVGVTAFTRLTRVTIGIQLGATAVTGVIWLVVVLAFVGPGPLESLIGLFILALAQPGVLATADLIDPDRAMEPTDSAKRRRRRPIDWERKKRQQKKRKKATGPRKPEPRQWSSMGRASEFRTWTRCGMRF